MKLTGLVILVGGVALVFLVRQLLKLSGLRPPALGPLSERWLFEQRRDTDDR